MAAMKSLLTTLTILISLVSCESQTEQSASDISTTTTGQSVTTATRMPATSAVATTTTLGRIRTQPIAGTQVTFRFDPDVSPEFLSRVSGYVLEAQTQVGDSGLVTLHVYSNLDEYVRENTAVTNRPADRVRGNIEQGGGAEALQRIMFLYEPSQGARPPDQLRSTVLHEYFHTVQFFRSGYKRAQGGDSPRWLFEGTAVYVQFRTAEALGYNPPPANVSPTYAVNRMRKVTNVKRANYGPLSAFESPGTAAEGGGAHDLGYVAADFMATRFGTEGLMNQYWVALAKSDWKAAFLSTFGLSVEDFYAEFEAYRKTL
jgi:hypothetical protein